MRGVSPSRGEGVFGPLRQMRLPCDAPLASRTRLARCTSSPDAASRLTHSLAASGLRSAACRTCPVQAGVCGSGSRPIADDRRNSWIVAIHGLSQYMDCRNTWIVAIHGLSQYMDLRQHAARRSLAMAGGPCKPALVEDFQHHGNTHILPVMSWPPAGGSPPARDETADVAEGQKAPPAQRPPTSEASRFLVTGAETKLSGPDERRPVVGRESRRRSALRNDRDRDDSCQAKGA
jgi:hypothetical protein